MSLNGETAGTDDRSGTGRRITGKSLLASLAPMRTPSSAAEATLLERADALVSFHPLSPRRVPMGYRLTALDHVPHSHSLLTMVFTNRRRSEFRFTQRVTCVSLADELVATSTPHHAVAHKARAYVVVTGAFVGEPIDAWHWHESRRCLEWEQAGLVCEIRQILGQSPPLHTLLRVAASVKAPEPAPLAQIVHQGHRLVEDQVTR